MKSGLCKTSQEKKQFAFDCFVSFNSNYAGSDDIQICSFNENKLNVLSSLLVRLSSIKSWLTSNYLQINSKKTTTLIIAPDKKIF